MLRCEAWLRGKAWLRSRAWPRDPVLGSSTSIVIVIFQIGIPNHDKTNDDIAVALAYHFPEHQGVIGSLLFFFQGSMKGGKNRYRPFSGLLQAELYWFSN